MATVEEQVESLVLSAVELRELNPNWQDEMVEEWLNIIRNILLLASTADSDQTQIDLNTANILINSGNISTNATNIGTNTTNIGTNTTNIGTNTTNIGTNTTDIGDNTTDITTNATNLTNHIADTTTHGASGDIVGNTDFATTSVAGVVLEAVAVTDGVNSTATVTSADATDLPTVITLANEIKADHNTLVTDFNNLVTQVNDFFAKARTSGILDT